jgi:hypothetical protein
MKLPVLLSIAAGYMAVAGLAFIFAPRAIGVHAVPTDASDTLIAYLRLFGSPFSGSPSSTGGRETRSRRRGVTPSSWGTSSDSRP